ncbi:MAG: TonB-dependent receptor, partial [Myxococcaceae bacterium]
MGSFLRGAILSLCLTSTALAEEPLVLPPVDVPISPVQEPPPESPTRRDVSGASTVIPVQERKGEAHDAAELLETSPGTVVSDTGGMGQAKSLSVRGASSNGVLVLLDGTPISEGGGG